jgi:hypothetical protein
MKPGIQISRVWSDIDVVELRIRVSDGTSSFTNQVYVDHATLEDAVSSLHAFKDQVHGGLLDLRFGEFGPEYKNGAFHARLHFPIPGRGRLYLSCEQESEFGEFGKKTVASRAALHVKSEPTLLDRFIAEMRALAAGTSEEAYLEAIL